MDHFFIEKNGNLAIVDFLYYGWLARPMDNLYPTFYGMKNKIEYNFYSNFYLCLQGGNYMGDRQGRAFVAEKNTSCIWRKSPFIRGRNNGQNKIFFGVE